MIGAITYLVMAAIYALPLVYLIKYSSAISRLRYSPSTSNLEEAIDRQRSFWKVVGIMILVGIVLMVMLAIFASMSASSASRSYNY